MRGTLVILFALFSVVFSLAPLHTTKEVIQDSYIVVFADDTPTEQLVSDLVSLQQAYNISYDFTYQYTIKGFAASLDTVQLSQIRGHPRVKFVEQNGVVRMSQPGCTLTTTPSWGLTRCSQRYPDLDGSYSYPSGGGAGVNVYVIDTGMRVTHTDFAGRARFGWKAINSWPSTDDQGHGTHVASTVGGRTFGIAKAVSLIAVKVLDASGSGSTAGVIGGVDWSTAQHRTGTRPSVGNMSLGGGYSAAINNAVNAASNEGLIMVVAGGNDNSNACNYSPASAANVVTCGSTTVGNNNQDTRSSFSNWGNCVSVFAPGSDITGAWIGSDTATRTISGTSMASPHVCGVAALIVGSNPNYSFQDVHDEILSLSTKNVINLQCGSAACNQSPNALLFNGCDTNK